MNRLPRRTAAMVLVGLMILLGSTGPAAADPTPSPPAGTTTPPTAPQQVEATEPDFDDPASKVTLPGLTGIQYAIDSGEGAVDVEPGEHTFEVGRNGLQLTVTATRNSDGQTWSWRHLLPEVVEPETPRYNDAEALVYAPGRWGMHYELISEDGSRRNLNPSSWNAASDTHGTTFTVEAVPNSNRLLLIGTTSWEHSFPYRPDYPITAGDEFNDNGLAQDWAITSNDGASSNRAVSRPENLSVTTTEEGEGVANVRIRRHCLTDPEGMPTDANHHPEVCPEGTTTRYSTGNFRSEHIYGTPRSMEVRAKLDPDHYGMTMVSWMHNDNQFCREGIPESDIAELDVLEVWDIDHSTASTHMMCDESGFNSYSVRTDQDIEGEWHTWRVEWDGYAVRYFLDGQLIDGSRGPHVSAEALGITQQDYSRIMNDYDWLIKNGTKLPWPGGWAPAVDDNEHFQDRNDQIDYIRVEEFNLNAPSCLPKGEIGKLAAQNTWLGNHQSCESDAFTAGSKVQVFDNGRIYWSPGTGARTVTGENLKKYLELGGDRNVGLPVGPEITGLRDGGASQAFSRGTLFWSPATGSHLAKGEILRKYASMGWENSHLGYPITDENCGLRDAGCFQRFQHHNGHIYWSVATGAHYTQGRIHDRYGEMGWETGVYGFPVIDEQCWLPNGGCFQRFQHERGHIYWSAATGPWNVQGEIFRHWGANGWESGRYGYPTSGERCYNVGRDRECVQSFQNGQITWNSARGAW